MSANAQPVSRTLTAIALLGGLTLGLTACGRGESDALQASTQPEPDGRALFQINCAACHGDTGRGDGLVSSSLRIKPRDLTTEPYKFVDVAGAESEVEALVTYINAGKDENGMPPFKHLRQRDVQAMAEFVASVRPVSGGTEAAPEGDPADTPTEETDETAGEG